MKYCQSCAAELADNAQSCPRCGYVFTPALHRNKASKAASILLCIFLWPLGIHRFICGDIGAGVAILIGNLLAWTIGLLILAPLWICPIAWLIDLITLCCDRRPIWN